MCDRPEFNCPCIGFYYGEQGQLELVRSRPGHPDEHLTLVPLFADAESPSTEGDQPCVLPRWPIQQSDFDRQPDQSEIASRPVVEIMRIADYDHDGRATEFVLQIGVFPCGHTDTVLIGLSKSNPTLHVFGSADAPDTPLRLERELWEQLRSAGSAHHTVLLCGDHGAETTVDVDLVSDAKGLHATRTEYECGPDFRRGKRIEPEP